MIQKIIKILFGESIENDNQIKNKNIVDLYSTLLNVKKEIELTGTIKDDSIFDLAYKLHLVKEEKKN